MPSASPEVAAEVLKDAAANIEEPAITIDDTVNGDTPNNVIDRSSAGKPSASSPPMMSATTSDLTLHSPSTQIVGTPFMTESRFEYPFPDNSGSPDALSSSESSPNFFSLSSSTNFQPTHSSHSLNLSSSPPTITSFQLPTDLPTHSFTHPKMRATNPPVPPSLVRKRQRWSLGLLRRRSGSTTSQSSDGSSRSPTGEATNGTRGLRASSDATRQTTVQEEASTSPRHADDP